MTRKPNEKLSIWHGVVTSRRRTMAEIVAEIAANHGIPAREIIGHERTKRLWEPRLEAYASCNEEGHSYPKIGRHFSGRHHTTVLAGARKHRQRAAA